MTPEFQESTHSKYSNFAEWIEKKKIGGEEKVQSF